jgi:hypothetical protein
MDLSKLSYYEEKELLENHNITSLVFKKFRLKIWSNKEIVLEILKNDGYYLKYVDEKLKRDKGIVYEAVKNYNRGSNDIFDYASEELKRDKGFILKLIVEGYESIYPYIDEELKRDRDYTLKLLKLNSYLFKYLDEEYKGDEEMIKEGLKDLDNLEYIENLTDNMILELFKNNKENIINELNEIKNEELKRIKERLEKKKLVIKLIKNKIDIYKILNKELRNDKEIIKYSMICLKKRCKKYKYINDLIENEYEYNYDKIRDNFKYILEMDNKVDIINKLIDEDIKRIKSDDVLINHIIDDEGLEEIFREKGVHFVEIIDQEDKNNFIDEMERKLKGEIIFYEG